MKYIKNFKDITSDDIEYVGGKNAALGQMIAALHDAGIRIPDGFAVTAAGYRYYCAHNMLERVIDEQMARVTDYHQEGVLRDVGATIRQAFLAGDIPEDLAQEIVAAYRELSAAYGDKKTDVAVRSSVTAEDLPTASFAGQQDTYLNVQGEAALLEACKKCMASLFTDRAIVYRIEQGFDYRVVALSVGVQKMIRSDLGASGVAFSLDTESGFADVVMIDAAWGLGEAIVKGEVIPDEFMVFKPTLEQGYASIIKKELGEKAIKIVYQNGTHTHGGVGTHQVPVAPDKQQQFSLTDDEVIKLARMVVAIESYYTEQAGRWSPMDVEWARDGNDGKIYIVEARPETIHAAQPTKNRVSSYVIADDDLPEPLLLGQSIGQKIASGPVRVVHDAAAIDQVKAGDILVTRITDPDWVPAMKRAAAIITEQGGRTCHAAIVGRELGAPVIVGVREAMATLSDGQTVTIDCSRGKTGYVYPGVVPFEEQIIDITKLKKPPVRLMLNIADPGRAFTLSFLPVDGVGLARLEFIITHAVTIHPMALVEPERITDANVRTKIDEITTAYSDKKQFFIDTVAHGISTIAAAWYPKPVIVRLSDFKTNEYRNLLGGSFFEPHEENPMLGLRGAARYTSPLYKPAFALECAALKKVRDQMGLTNIALLVPFVRTLSEARTVRKLLGEHGVGTGSPVYMMCEVPSNVILRDEFVALFDGISIGSNDLTQLTLGVDRDSALLADAFNEQDPAVQKMMRLAIESTNAADKYSGICGQAPSDFPELALELIDAGIRSISLNADAVLSFLQWYTDRQKK